MKLVDILARELKAWPSNCTSGYCAQAYSSTEVFFGGPAESLMVSEMADDGENAEVTRAQWQAAVDALKAESAPAWTGEGLPPAGTVCEYKHVSEWQKVDVFAVKPNYNGSHTALFTYENGTWCGCAEPSFFRHIRTPERIAAEEREKAADAMSQATRGAKDWMEAFRMLHDAGFAKQVQP